MSEAQKSKKEIILDYLSKHPNPIQDKCPIIVQKWPRTEKGVTVGHVFWNSETGKRTTTFNERKYQENNKRFQTWYTLRSPSSYGYDYTYTNYIPELEMIHIGIVHLTGGRHKDGEKEEWTWAPYSYVTTMLFLFKGDLNPYDKNGDVWHPEAMGKYYNKELITWFKTLQYYKAVPFCQDEFEAFAGVKNYQINSWAAGLSCPAYWGEWYKQSAPRNTSKHQIEINDLNKIELTPLETLQNKYPFIKTYEPVKNWRGQMENDWVIKALHYVHFEIINDKMCVLRILNRSSNDSDIKKWESGSYPEFTETCRVYITDKGKVTITRYNQSTKTFQIQTGNLSAYQNYYTKQHTIFGNLEEIKKWTRLSWIYDIVLELHTIKYSYYNYTIIPELIVLLLRHPIVEKIYKAGYKNLTKIIIQNNTIAANLKLYFNVKENNKGSITKILGCNKDMLKWMDDNCIKTKYNYYGNTEYEEIQRDVMLMPAVLKELFVNQDLSSWSKESIDTYCPSMLQVLEMSGKNWQYYLLPENSIYPHYYYYRHRRNDEQVPLTEKEQAICIHFLKMGKKDPEILRAYIDTVTMYKNLRGNNLPEVDSLYKMNNIEDIQHFHNAITELYNQQQEEQRAYWDKQAKERLEQDKKKFENLQKERKEKYNFETPEDEYLIKIPEALTELTTEGQTLHHCVGSYLHHHAVGDTNILFLRKKSAPSIPFFTIEVKNQNVVQIHGKFNSWIGSDSNASPIIKFLIKWLKAKGIYCPASILLCKSTSYGSGNEYLDGAEFGL